MRGRIRLIAIFVSIALVSAATFARAQETTEDLFGQTVAELIFDIEGRRDLSPALPSLVDVKVGQILTPDLVRSSISRLANLGRYDDVKVDGVVTPAGVSVTFFLTPRHPINRIEVAGDSGIPSSALTSRVRERYGGVPTGVRTANVEATARQLLSDEGYLDATVSSEVVLSHDPDAATLVLHVNAGPRMRIVRTDVVSAILPDADVVRRTGAQVGQPYRQREIAAALASIEDDLRRRGYYEVQGNAEPTREAEGVSVRIVIEEGPRVELRVMPANVLSRGDIADLIPVEREGSADQDLLEDSTARIRAHLQRQGYWRAQAPFSREPQANGTVLLVTFNITRGPLYVVDRIDLPAGLAVPAASIRDLLDVSPGQIFDQSRFEAGVARLIDEYRRRGYYNAEAKPEYETVAERTTAERAAVILHPNLNEGPQGHVTAITFAFEGQSQVSELTLRQAMRATVGAPYIELDAAADQDTLRALYVDRGFRSAALQIAPTFSSDGHDVTLTVSVNEGQKIVVGEISVIGNERVSQRTILEEMGLSIGDPLGQSAFDEARERLTQMGVFRRVVVTIEEPLGGETQARLVVSVVEASATTIGFGGGLEGGRRLRSVEGGGFEDHLQFSPRGFFEIGRRNLGGRNRAVNLFSRLSLRPRVAPGDPEHDGRGFGFSEYRMTGTYRERHAFRSDSDLLISLTSEQAVRTTFNYARQVTSAELLHRLNPQVSISGRYALEFTRLFDERIPPDEQPVIDRLFPQIRLSMLSAGVSWDRRDNPLVPTRGTLASADAELAAEAIGSQVGYIKGFFQLSGFRALDSRARSVLALRAQLGVARGFRDPVPIIGPDGAPLTSANGQPLTEVDVPISQRFFAGGGTTVRGFQLDRLGAPEILNPDGLSLGGNAVTVFNAELRRVVATLLRRNLALVGFVDAGNVFARASDVEFGRLRGATGFGVRYDSPLGPLRLDFGFKKSREVIGDRRERGWEYHLSIGEAF